MNEALRLAEFLEMHWCNVDMPEAKAAAELRRLSAENDRLQARYEACRIAAHQWLDKTEWIQETGRGCELGMHRADAVRQRLSAVEAQRDALLEALRTLLSYAFTLEMRLLDADGEHRAMQQARAAIAAVEGEKS